MQNEDLHCAISKSRTCCHSSFEDNLPSCYILETWITVYSLSISHEFWKSMTSTVTKIDSIFFNLFIFVFNVRFTLFIFIKRSHSSPILINFVLHLLCLDTLTSVFTVSILSWMIEWIYVYSGIWIWKYQIWYRIQCCNEIDRLT